MSHLDWTERFGEPDRSRLAYFSGLLTSWPMTPPTAAPPMVLPQCSPRHNGATNGTNARPDGGVFSCWVMP